MDSDNDRNQTTNIFTQATDFCKRKPAIAAVLGLVCSLPFVALWGYLLTAGDGSAQATAIEQSTSANQEMSPEQELIMVLTEQSERRSKESWGVLLHSSGNTTSVMDCRRFSQNVPSYVNNDLFVGRSAETIITAWVRGGLEDDAEMRRAVENVALSLKMGRSTKRVDFLQQEILTGCLRHYGY
jgi:hypothetical protein